MIIVCEPQCMGLEHVDFNAAFLAALNAAYPGAGILFLAEKGHSSRVRARLSEYQLKGIEYAEIDLPPRGLLNHQRFGADRRLVRSVYGLAADRNAGKIIFTSANSSVLIAVKMLSRKSRGPGCLVVLHAILETVLKKRPPLKPFVWRSYLELPFWFRLALLYGNTEGVGYIVLGASILERLCKTFPRLKARAFSIDLPYLYEKPYEFEPFSGGAVRFGSLGVASRSKGSDLFFKMADDTCSAVPAGTVEFVQIGPVDRKLKSAGGSVRIPKDDTFLERAQYDGHVSAIDYAVFFHRPSSYRLTASASLFDAFSHLKPVIALRSPFFEHYFKEMGDIGYLCDDYEAMKQVILRIIEDRPKDRYRSQRDNILKGRKKLGIAGIGKKIRMASGADGLTLKK